MLIDVERILNSDEPLTADVLYQGTFILEMELWGGDELNNAIAKAIGPEPGAKLTEDQARDLWLSKVKGWRGLYDRNAQPVPFDRTLLERMWRVLPPSFRRTVIQGSQRAAHFLGAGAIAPALPPREAPVGAAAG